jgi:hypothetical protein
VLTVADAGAASFVCDDGEQSVDAQTATCAQAFSAETSGLSFADECGIARKEKGRPCDRPSFILVGGS